jgi:hypothetical protein
VPTQQPTDALPSVPSPLETASHLTDSCGINALREQFVTLQIECQRLGEQIAALERQRKDKEEFADDLLTQIRQMEEEPADESPATGEVIEVDGVVSVVQEVVPESRPSPMPTSWRDVSIAVLNLPTISGMGKTKREKLIERVGTLGQLEKLRQQAIEEHRPLCALLPKGVGKDLADEIEERYLRWKDSYDNIGAPTKPSYVDHVADVDTAAKVLVETNETFHPQAQLPPVDLSPLPDLGIVLDTDEAAAARYNELRAAYFANGGSFGDLATLKANRASGRAAAGMGWDSADCPHPPGIEQDSWFAGFIESSLPTSSEDPVNADDIGDIDDAESGDEAAADSSDGNAADYDTPPDEYEKFSSVL